MNTYRNGGWSLLLGLFLAWTVASLGPRALSAQTVTGRVLDEDGETAMPRVSIEAFGRDDAPLGGTVTDPSGRFTLRLPGPLPYFRVEIRAFTYRRHTADSLSIAAEQTIALGDVVMQEVPITLAPITAAVDQPLVSRGSEWIRRGQLTGKGTFVAGAVLMAIEPPSLTEYLAQNAGLRVYYNIVGFPYLRSTDTSVDRCIRVFLNRWPLGSTMFPNMDMIPMSRIAAIEVYNTWRDVPEPLAWDADGCGLVNIWTWDSY